MRITSENRFLDLYTKPDYIVVFNYISSDRVEIVNRHVLNQSAQRFKLEKRDKGCPIPGQWKITWKESCNFKQQ